MQSLKLRLQLAYALEEREHQRQPMGLQLEIVEQAARGSSRHHAFGPEGPESGAGIDRRQRTVVDQLAQSHFLQARELGEPGERDLSDILYPSRLGQFDVHVPSSKCWRGLNVDAAASCCISSRSRSVAVPGTAICAMA